MNIFLFKTEKINTTKILQHFFISFKQNKKKVAVIIPENTGHRVFSVRKTKVPTEYREKGIRYFKN